MMEMFRSALSMREFKKMFSTDRSGKFKSMKFNWGGNDYNFNGKDITELGVEEVVVLKKYISSIVDNLFEDIKAKGITDIDKFI